MCSTYHLCEQMNGVRADCKRVMSLPQLRVAWILGVLQPTLQAYLATATIVVTHECVTAAISVLSHPLRTFMFAMIFVRGLSHS
jgi:hypothetical protein